jgi:ubiquitin-conjugating enzyme E2 O
MDLLRAAMLGPEGTPYADQLFVFDIQLAAQHPAAPPKVLYHSWGLRVNPNLYEDGKARPLPLTPGVTPRRGSLLLAAP